MLIIGHWRKMESSLFVPSAIFLWMEEKVLIYTPDFGNQLAQVK